MLNTRRSGAKLVKNRSVRLSQAAGSVVERLEGRQMMAAHVLGSTALYATIQAAVNAAPAGGTVTVDAGTYAEQVTITKSLTVRGAQAGIDARLNDRLNGPVSAESVMTGALSGTTRTASFVVSANDVTIDGFTVQGETSQSLSSGAGIVISPNRSGTHVVNNIVQNNVAGLFLANASATDPAVIQHNVFRANNNAGVNGGRGIYTDQTISGGNLTNVTIDANAFINNRGGSGTTGLEAAMAFEAGTTNAQSNIRITNNLMDGNGKAVLFFHTTGVTLTGNEVTYTLDRYSGTFRFEGDNHNVTIRNNTLYDNTGPAVAVDSKGVPGDSSGFVVTGNNFYGNSTGWSGSHLSVVVNGDQYTGAFDARNNYWGSPTGPGGDGPGTGDWVYGKGHVVSGNQWYVTTGGTETFSPWATAPIGTRRAPYFGAASDTGAVIQAEDFDQGGEGVAYHDATKGNSGGVYRTNEGVDIEATTDTGAGYDVGNAAAGEWLGYTVNVPQTGDVPSRLPRGQPQGRWPVPRDGGRAGRDRGDHRPRDGLASDVDDGVGADRQPVGRHARRADRDGRQRRRRERRGQLQLVQADADRRRRDARRPDRPDRFGRERHDRQPRLAGQLDQRNGLQNRAQERGGRDVGAGRRGGRERDGVHRHDRRRGDGLLLPRPRDQRGRRLDLLGAASVTTPAVATAPAKLSAAALSATSVSLSWADTSAGVTTGFLIERSTDGVTFAQVGATAANVTLYTDTAAAGTTYTYRVRATSAGGPSAYGNTASATTVSAATSPPT